MAEAVVGLGANLGDRETNIRQAIHALGRLPHTSVTAVSSLYETEPFGVPDVQPNYLNCCVRLQTALSPHALLGACLGIEAQPGRVRIGEKSARVLDADLLLYENASFQTEELTLPHPRMLERAFVLIPLAELYPSQNALGINFSVAQACVEEAGVKKYNGG